MTRSLALLLIASTVLTGCVSTPEGDDDPTDIIKTCGLGLLDPPGTRILNTTDDPIVDDKALMWDHEAYNARTCSLPAIGWSGLNPDGDPHKYIGEIDLRGDLDLGTVAVLGNGETPRVYILDITDRNQPEVLSYIDQVNTYIVDVKITDDGKYLYTASQGQAQLNDPTGPTPWADAGFTVYSLADPKAPRYIGTVVDASGGCHMLSVVQVAANQDAVFCVATQVRSYLIQREETGLTNLGFVDYVPSEDGRPAPSTTVAPGTEGLATSGPHDMTPYHEGGAFGDGRSYMIVSHWDSGVRILDITDAPQITELGAWKGQGATHYHGNVHTAMMFDVGDDRYIIASPEYTDPSAEEVPSLWVLDANDLTNPTLIGQWYHPNEHIAQGLYLTTHQWQVAPTGADVTVNDTRVYLTYNHGGIWVLDFAKMLDQDMQGAILGFNAARTPLDQDNAVANAVLSTWDVNVVDGYIYGSDRATGLWVFHYTEDELGDKRLTGFA